MALQYQKVLEKLQRQKTALINRLQTLLAIDSESKQVEAIIAKISTLGHEITKVNAAIDGNRPIHLSKPLPEEKRDDDNDVHMLLPSTIKFAPQKPSEKRRSNLSNLELQ